MRYILSMCLIIFSLPVLGEDKKMMLSAVPSREQARLMENCCGIKKEVKRESSFNFPELKPHTPVRDFIKSRQLQLFAFDENAPERGRVFAGRSTSPVKIPGLKDKFVGFAYSRDVGILDK